MEIDKEELREFLLWLWGIVETTQSDLLAHKVVFTLLKATGQFNEIDQWLEKARKNPSPKLLERHKEARETLERLLAKKIRRMP